MQRILITGANRGLGLEFARQYLARGERVFATARDPERAADLMALAAEYPHRLSVLQLDVADEAGIQACVRALRAETDALDILLNNAGMNMPTSEQSIGQISAEPALHLLRVNTIAPLLLAQAALDLLRQGNKPRLINVTSGMGSMGLGVSGHVLYSASKAALNMISRRLSQDPAFKGIIVLALDPGWVKTDMGGPRATYELADAITRNIKFIDGLISEHNGRYFNLNGNELPW